MQQFKWASEHRNFARHVPTTMIKCEEGSGMIPSRPVQTPCYLAALPLHYMCEPLHESRSTFGCVVLGRVHSRMLLELYCSAGLSDRPPTSVALGSRAFAQAALYTVSTIALWADFDVNGKAGAIPQMPLRCESWKSRQGIRFRPRHCGAVAARSESTLFVCCIIIRSSLGPIVANATDIC